MSEMTTKEFIIQALEDGKVNASFLNQRIMEISKSRGKKPGFVKFAVSDETAADFMMGRNSVVGIVLMIDREYTNKLIDSGPKGIDATE